jgi:hypothetical protein
VSIEAESEVLLVTLTTNTPSQSTITHHASRITHHAEQLRETSSTSKLHVQVSVEAESEVPSCYPHNTTRFHNKHAFTINNHTSITHLPLPARSTCQVASITHPRFTIKSWYLTTTELAPYLPRIYTSIADLLIESFCRNLQIDYTTPITLRNRVHYNPDHTTKPCPLQPRVHYNLTTMSWKNLSQEEQDWIDKEKWGKDLSQTEVREADEKVATGHILFSIRYYRDKQFEDYRLWDNFRNDFEGWTKDTFLKAGGRLITALRDHLRDHGVFVAIANQRRIAENLAEVCDSRKDEYHEWTEEEVEYQMRNGNVFRSRFNPDPTRKEGSIYRVLSGTPPTVSNTQIPRQTSFQTNRPSHQYQTQHDSTSKRITDLEKLYNEEKKFGGGLYDILDSKIKIFHDNCTRIGLPKTMYNVALPTMLKGRASDYYYDQLSGRDYDFEYMIFKLKAHFNTDENRQEYMAEWRETTFSRMITANPDKSRLEVLQMLFDKLQNVQRGLLKDYEGPAAPRTPPPQFVCQRELTN